MSSAHSTAHEHRMQQHPSHTTTRPSRSRSRMPSTPNITTPSAPEARTSHQLPQFVPPPQPSTPTTTPARNGRRSLSPIGGAANAMKKFFQRRRGTTANGLVITGPFPQSSAPWTPPEAEDDVEGIADLSHTSFGQLASGFYTARRNGSSSSFESPSSAAASAPSPCPSPISPTSPKTPTGFWSGLTSGRRGRQGRTASVTMLPASSSSTSLPISTSSSTSSLMSTFASETCMDPNKPVPTSFSETNPCGSTTTTTTTTVTFSSTATNPMPRHQCSIPNTTIFYTKHPPSSNDCNSNGNSETSSSSSTRKKNFQRSISVDSVLSPPYLPEMTEATAQTQTIVQSTPQGRVPTAPLPASQIKSPLPPSLQQKHADEITAMSTATPTNHKQFESSDPCIHPTLSGHTSIEPNDAVDGGTRTELMSQDVSLGSLQEDYSFSSETAVEGEGAVSLTPESIGAMDRVCHGKEQRAATANLGSFSLPSSSLSSTATSSTVTTAAPLPCPITSETITSGKSTPLPDGTMTPHLHLPLSPTSSLPIAASMTTFSPSGVIASSASSQALPSSSFGRHRATRRQSESYLQSKVKVPVASSSPGNTHANAIGSDMIRKYSVPLLPPAVAAPSNSELAEIKEDPTLDAALVEEDGKMLLISSHSSPTHFYDLPSTRAKVRRFLTSLAGFEEVLEYGFPSDVEVEDTSTEGGGSLGCRYLTLRLTLTPWHARADDAQIYGAAETQGSKQQQFKTMVTKFFSRASSSGPLLANMTGGRGGGGEKAALAASPSSLSTNGCKSKVNAATLADSASSDILASVAADGPEKPAEYEHELCTTAEIPLLRSQECLGFQTNDDSIDSIVVDLPPPCHPFEEPEMVVVHDMPTWGLTGASVESDEPKHPLTKSGSHSSYKAHASPITPSFPSEIPKPLKNQGFNAANPLSSSPIAAVTNITTNTHSVMNTMMTTTIPSSPFSVALASTNMIFKDGSKSPTPLPLSPVSSSPPRYVTPSTLAVTESQQPLRKGSLPAFSIPIAASATSAAASSNRALFGTLASVNLDAPTISARRKASSPAIVQSSAVRQPTIRESPTTKTTTTTPRNVFQDGFRIRDPTSPLASSLPTRWPVYIPSSMSSTKASDPLTAYAGLIPVDGFASRKKRERHLDLQQHALSPKSSNANSLITVSPSPSPVPSPLQVPIGTASQPHIGAGMPPPRLPRKRSGQPEKSPLGPVPFTATTTTTTSRGAHNDPPFEDVLLSKPLASGMLYTDRLSSVSSSSSLSSSSSVVAATTTSTPRPQPVVKSDVFFETPAGLPNYQMDYVVSVDPTLTPAHESVKASSYVLDPPREPYQPRTRYVPSRLSAAACSSAGSSLVTDDSGFKDTIFTSTSGVTPTTLATTTNPTTREGSNTDINSCGKTSLEYADENDQVWGMVTTAAALPPSLSSTPKRATEKSNSDGGEGGLGQDGDTADNLSHHSRQMMTSYPAATVPTNGNAVATLEAAAAAVAAAAAAVPRDDDNIHSADHHQRQNPRRMVATASMVMAELRRPGQGQYVYGWDDSGSNSPFHASFDPACHDEEDMIFGAYDYSYDDDNDIEDDDKEQQEGDIEEEPFVENGEPRDQKRRKNIPVDARSEASEATTIYGRACIGIRMRAEQRSSLHRHSPLAIATVRPHGQVVVTPGGGSNTDEATA